MAGTVELSFSDDREIATLTLGSPDERVITLTPSRLGSFREALDRVKASGVRGLVIRAPSLDSFCVGADISLIQGVTDPSRGAALAIEGQEAYNILEDLPCVTVAAISGPCVGGGCELVLACDFRVASDTSATSIGLPETKLGILPGFGGTYRLPRLVGLPKALDIILAGKTLRSAQALKAGLIDEVTHTDDLVRRAEEIARGKRTPRRRSRRFMDRLLSNNPLGRAIVKRSALKATLKQTKGFYPAPPIALSITADGLGHSRTSALSREATQLGKLIVSAESKALTHLFFLTEASKGLGKSARSSIEGTHALVVGAGTMGAGIAGTLARCGHQVIVKDTSDSSLQRGKDHVQREVSKLRYLSSLERAAITNRIDWLQCMSPTVSRTNLVIEAIF